MTTEKYRVKKGTVSQDGCKYIVGDIIDLNPVVAGGLSQFVELVIETASATIVSSSDDDITIDDTINEYVGFLNESHSKKELIEHANKLGLTILAAANKLQIAHAIATAELEQEDQKEASSEV